MNIRASPVRTSDVDELIKVLSVFDEIELVDIANRARKKSQQVLHRSTVRCQHAVAQNIGKIRCRNGGAGASGRVRNQIEVAESLRFILTEFRAEFECMLTLGPAQRVRVGVKRGGIAPCEVRGSAQQAVLKTDSSGARSNKNRQTINCWKERSGFWSVCRIIHCFVLNAVIPAQSPARLINDVWRQCGNKINGPDLRSPLNGAPEAGGKTRPRIVHKVSLILPLHIDPMFWIEVVVDSDVDLV